MNVFDLKLELDYEGLELGSGHQAYMTCLLPYSDGYLENDLRPAVIVCPGGAYHGLADREAEPIAMQYVAQGMAAFVLYYSTNISAAHPRDLLEGLCAIKTVREHAQEWKIDPDKIAVCGFSAGGHFSATIGAFWNSDIASKAFGNCECCKPNAVILGYPVITSDPAYRHSGSFSNLMGADEPQGVWDSVSTDRLVTESYPPTFLWHTATDKGVHVCNSLLMAKALADHKVTFELHVYPQGPHGLALSDKRTAPRAEGLPRPEMLEEKPRRWMAESVSFLENFAFKK